MNATFDTPENRTVLTRLGTTMIASMLEELSKEAPNLHEAQVQRYATIYLKRKLQLLQAINLKN